LSFAITPAAAGGPDMIAAVYLKERAIVFELVTKPPIAFA
jgi:hypothetical protein